MGSRQGRESEKVGIIPVDGNTSSSAVAELYAIRADIVELRRQLAEKEMQEKMLEKLVSDLSGTEAKGREVGNAVLPSKVKLDDPVFNQVDPRNDQVHEILPRAQKKRVTIAGDSVSSLKARRASIAVLRTTLDSARRKSLSMISPGDMSKHVRRSAWEKIHDMAGIPKRKKSTPTEIPPCPKTFSCFFFKAATGSMTSRGLAPAIDSTVPVEQVRYKRLLYESAKTWFVLLYFRNTHWVAIRPSRNMESASAKAAHAADPRVPFKWEGVARSYMLTRISRMREQQPDREVYLIANVETSEAWACVDVDDHHPCVTDENILVSLEPEAGFHADNLPWVKEMTDLMTVRKPHRQSVR